MVFFLKDLIILKIVLNFMEPPLLFISSKHFIQSSFIDHSQIAQSNVMYLYSPSCLEFFSFSTNIHNILLMLLFSITHR